MSNHSTDIIHLWVSHNLQFKSFIDKAILLLICILPTYCYTDCMCRSTNCTACQSVWVAYWVSSTGCCSNVLHLLAGTDVSSNFSWLLTVPYVRLLILWADFLYLMSQSRRKWKHKLVPNRDLSFWLQDTHHLINHCLTDDPVLDWKVARQINTRTWCELPNRPKV